MAAEPQENAVLTRGSDASAASGVRHEPCDSPETKEMTMESLLELIPAPLGLLAGGAVLALALARRRRGVRTTNLGLWSPAAEPLSVESGTTPRAK